MVRSSHGRGWHGVEAAEVVHPQDDFALPAIPRHVLVVNLSGPVDAHDRLAGRAGRLGQGGLALLPARAEGFAHPACPALLSGPVAPDLALGETPRGTTAAVDRAVATHVAWEETAAAPGCPPV